MPSWVLPPSIPSCWTTPSLTMPCRQWLCSICRLGFSHPFACMALFVSNLFFIPTLIINCCVSDRSLENSVCAAMAGNQGMPKKENGKKERMVTPSGSLIKGNCIQFYYFESRSSRGPRYKISFKLKDISSAATKRCYANWPDPTEDTALNVCILYTLANAVSKCITHNPQNPQKGKM